MPCVRSSQISFRVSIASYSSIAFGIHSTNLRHSASKPRGMSSASPPAWK